MLRKFKHCIYNYFAPYYKQIADNAGAKATFQLHANYP